LVRLGRRLRDINEEKRVKDFLAKGGTSTEDPEECKKRKLQRLSQAPKTELKNELYKKNLSEMTESVSDAKSVVSNKYIRNSN